jgi:hypothetical protein
MLMRLLMTAMLVALLAPHEPDLGLGRPALLGGRWRDDMLAGLARVQADIRRDQAARQTPNA